MSKTIPLISVAKFRSANTSEVYQPCKPPDSRPTLRPGQSHRFRLSPLHLAAAGCLHSKPRLGSRAPCLVLLHLLGRAGHPHVCLIILVILTHLGADTGRSRRHGSLHRRSRAQGKSGTYQDPDALVSSAASSIDPQEASSMNRSLRLSMIFCLGCGSRGRLNVFHVSCEARPTRSPTRQPLTEHYAW